MSDIIEIKETSNNEEKRVIIKISESQTIGVLMTNIELYELYSTLRELFKDN